VFLFSQKKKHKNFSMTEIGPSNAGYARVSRATSEWKESAQGASSARAAAIAAR
jgi:hypothetical protein